MTSINSFIEKEEQSLSNILFGLPVKQRIKYSPKIQYIQYLLTLLEDNSSTMSPKEKKEIKDKIEKETKELNKKTKTEQSDALDNFNLTKIVKPTLTELDESTIMKAKMVQASKIANVNDFNTAQDYLDNNKIPYSIDTDLSDSETLILHNPETGDVKLASRGTQITNAKDLMADGMAIAGNESNNPEFVKAEVQGQKAITKYGKANVSEGLGFSLGGAKQIYVTDVLGIPNSTTFNPLITLNAVNKGKSSTQHRIVRTTEDLPSTMIGFKGLVSNADNWTVDSILPKKISLDVREAHKHSNFLDNDGRVSKSQLNDLLTNVSNTGKRKGEAEIIRDMANYFENKNPIRPISNNDAPTADPLLRTKQASHSHNDPFLDHYIQRTTREDGISFRDQMLRNEPVTFSREESDILNDLMQGNPTSGKRTNKIRNKIPDVLKNKTDYSKEKQEIKNDLQDINEELPQHEELHNNFSPEDVKGTSAEARYKASQFARNRLIGRKEDLNNRLEEIEQLEQNESQEWKSRIENNPYENNIKSHEDLLNNLIPKPNKIILKDNLNRIDPLLTQETEPIIPTESIPTENKTYTDFMHNFQSRQGTDTRMNNGKPELKSNRFNKGSKFHSLWEEMGGSFTQKELNHFDSLPDTETSDFALSQKERHFMMEDSINGRDEQIKQYTEDHIDSVNEADNYTSIPDGENVGGKRSVTNDLIRAGSPTNFLIGYYASKLTNKGLDMIDPLIHLNPIEKEATSGAISALLTDAAIAGLSGAGPASVLTFEIAAPVLVAGAVGGVVGGETYQALDKKGVIAPVNSAISGAAAGASAAATGMLVAAGAAAATGGAIGTAFDPVTFGLGTVIGAGIGGLAGEASYLMGKAGL
tara:strand:- start:6327 stop:8945 length:2619 start_codon:yes stop_codon:yes gene_type:complete